MKAIQIINQEPDFTNHAAAVAQVLNREDGAGAVVSFIKNQLRT